MPLTGYSYSRQIIVKNTSGESKTNPTIPIALYPRAGIRRGVWTCDGAIYRRAIPCNITELSGNTLTGYEFLIGPVDTKWLVDNGWATGTGNEVRFVADDSGSPDPDTLLDFFLEPNPGWNDRATYYRVVSNWTGYVAGTVWLMCDDLLTSQASASDPDHMEFFEDFSAFVNASETTLMGSTSPSGTNVSSGVLVAVRVMASAGTVTHVRVGTAVAGNIRVGIYADNGSGTAPTGDHLTESDSTACVVGENSIDVPDLAVTAQYYWLVFNSDTTGVMQRNSSGLGTAKYKAVAYGALPDLTGYSWTGDLTHEYAIAGLNIISASLAGWTVVSGIPSYSAGVLTLPSGASIRSDSSWGLGHGASIYAKCGAAGAAASRWGFSDSDASDVARFTHDSTNDYAVATAKASTATTTPDQSPFPVGSYALWQIIRSKDETNKDEWVKFLVDRVHATDTPQRTNIPTDSLPITLIGGTNGLSVKWVMVTQAERPAPMVNIATIYHHPQAVFMDGLCAHWPHDVEVAPAGETEVANTLKSRYDKTTLSSEYATILKVKYAGTLAADEEATLEISFGNDSQDTEPASRVGADAHDFYDDFSGDEGKWSDTSGSWDIVDQVRPLVTDYSRMNVDADYSYVALGSPSWVGSDGVERFISFVGSWAGLQTNNQGNPQWPIPWRIVLWEKPAGWNHFYAYGNVMNVENNGAYHASNIPYWMWVGDGGYLGKSGAVYVVLGATTIANGDFRSWILMNEDGLGKEWKVLNGGVPFATYESVSGGTSYDKGRFTQVVWDSEHSGYIIPFGWWDYSDDDNKYDKGYILYNNTAGASGVDKFKAMLHETDTIDPTTFWSTSGALFTITQNVETYWLYKNTSTGVWWAICETILDRNLEAVQCTGTFEPTMDGGDWEDNGTDITDLDDIYENTRGDVAIPMIQQQGSTFVMYYDGQNGDYSDMTLTQNIYRATASAIGRTGWTPDTVKERKQATVSHTADTDWKISLAASGGTPLTLASGVIESGACVGGAGDYDFVGVIWRHYNANNFWAWYIDHDHHSLAYGHMDNGAWAEHGHIHLGEGPWRGELYELAVDFQSDGTTDLKYRRLGFEWVTAFDGVTCHALTSAGTQYGKAAHNAAAFFSEYRVYQRGDYSIELAPMKRASGSPSQALLMAGAI